MFPNPRHLITTAELERGLGNPGLRMLDSTVFLRQPSPDAPRSSWVRESGRAHWEESHIPGSSFADLIHDLSEPDSRLPFTLPSEARFEAAMSALGVGEGTRAVIYDAAGSMWAARLWWMLRVYGFEDVAVLDGGWKKWKAEGRPVTNARAAVPDANFVARLNQELLATKDDVLAATEDGAACIIDALAPDQYSGAAPPVYGRQGHITTSVNVSARDLVDAETGAFLPADVLGERFSAVGATSAGRVITYCGGGIAATADALVLALLGNENVAVYDGSLSEWANDASLPMEVSRG